MSVHWEYFNRMSKRFIEWKIAPRTNTSNWTLYDWNNLHRSRSIHCHCIHKNILGNQQLTIPSTWVIFNLFWVIFFVKMYQCNISELMYSTLLLAINQYVHYHISPGKTNIVQMTCLFVVHFQIALLLTINKSVIAKNSLPSSSDWIVPTFEKLIFLSKCPFDAEKIEAMKASKMNNCSTQSISLQFGFVRFVKIILMENGSQEFWII